MNTFSKYVQITSDKLFVNIPDGFSKGYALITITSVPENDKDLYTESDKKVKFRNLLLKKSFILTDDQIDEFENIKKCMNEWNTNNY